MIPVRNLKLKECCCGCTLRTGSLILLWIFLAYESCSTLMYLSELLFYNRRMASYSYSRYSGDDGRLQINMTYLTFRSLYYLITSIIGLVFSVLGIYGIQKNTSKYLNLGLFYLGYYVGFAIFSIFLLIFVPSKYAKFILNTQKFQLIGNSELVFVAVVGYCFAIAAMVYFYVVLQSYKDSMERNVATGRPNEIPDASALGYNVV